MKASIGSQTDIKQDEALQALLSGTFPVLLKFTNTTNQQLMLAPLKKALPRHGGEATILVPSATDLQSVAAEVKNVAILSSNKQALTIEAVQSGEDPPKEEARPAAAKRGSTKGAKS